MKVAPIKTLVGRLRLRGERLIAVAVGAVFLLTFSIAYLISGRDFSGAMWVTVAVTFALLLTILMVTAGFTVLKSLFLVGGEISLVIFLAQSYCAVPSRAAASNAALRTLLILSSVYILSHFVRSLYKTLRDYSKEAKQIPWSKDKAIIIVLFLILTAVFLWQLILVVSPIVRNLCVFQDGSL